ncbi:MAG: prepilin-type N-terminal cleavage/methylation domain-containing protein [Luteimonas sp.]
MKPTGVRRARQTGFSLLEAIVALTVFSICATALFAWLSVNVNALSRVDARRSAIDDGRTALAVLEGVNPMAEPRGERALPGSLLVRWTSREIAKRKPAISTTNSPLIFDIALYAMDVQVMHGGRETSHFTLQRAGWESTRTLVDGDL